LTLFTLSAAKISNFLKCNMADGLQLGNRKILVTVSSIATKFGKVKVTHIDPLYPTGH